MSSRKVRIDQFEPKNKVIPSFLVREDPDSPGHFNVMGSVQCKGDCTHIINHVDSYTADISPILRTSIPQQPGITRRPPIS